MQLTIKGEEELYARFNSLNKVMKTTFWGLVKTDLKDTLDKNVKPHATGRSSKLERNVYAKKIDDGVEGGVGNEGMLVRWNGLSLNYATFVNGGTSGPYPITPKNKKVLRWQGSNGRNVFAKEVMHPGIKASHFIERTAKETFGRLDEMFTESLKKENVI